MSPFESCFRSDPRRSKIDMKLSGVGNSMSCAGENGFLALNCLSSDGWLSMRGSCLELSVIEELIFHL